MATAWLCSAQPMQGGRVPGKWSLVLEALERLSFLAIVGQPRSWLSLEVLNTDLCLYPSHDGVVGAEICLHLVHAVLDWGCVAVAQ